MRGVRCRPTVLESGLFAGLLFQMLLLAPGALGQTPGDRVREFAESASGYTLISEIQTGSLPSRQEVTVPVTMITGSEYLIVGFCDESCTDLNLAVLDNQGREVEVDDLPDPQPMILVSPEISGGHRVRLDMVACAAEPCSYAVGILQGDGTGVGFQDPGDTMEDRFRAIREDLTEEGFSEMGPGTAGSLQVDEETRISLDLQEGLEYRIVGVCDNECENLDLALFGSSGEEAAADRMEDAFPMLNVAPLPEGEYRLAVEMVACTLEPCTFQVFTFAKGPGLAPGGIPVTGKIIFQDTDRGTLRAGDALFEGGEYYDEYRIRLKAGQTIIADLRSWDFDTFLVVESPAGEAEANDDYDENLTHSHVEWMAPEDGFYSVLVSSFVAGAEGSYILQVAVVEGS